ncbi:MAG: nucleoside 2-deoxyribosyltransferase [Lactobacillus sp.]|nr:nucleoside 2-deoxyribosyltransferase [Lactobacillus sp.]
MSNENIRQKTVYFAAGWFSPKQTAAYDQVMAAIKQNKTIDDKNSYVPLEHQYKGLRVDEHPELLADKEWQTATFNGDCVGIKSSDLFLCTYLPDEEDIGCGVELGLAKALGKYIVIVIPDEDYGKPINLMSWGAADTVIKVSELADFDFNKPYYNFYEGEVY